MKPIEIDRLLSECAIPLAAGNTLFPIRKCVEIYASSRSPVDRSIAAVVLREILSRLGNRLTAAERRRVNSELRRLRRADPSSGGREVLRSLNGTRARRAKSAIGRANALLVSTTTVWGRHFGACVPLTVTAGPRRGEIQLTYVERGQLLEQAFWVGAVAALHVLARNGLGDLHGAQILGSRSYLGTFDEIAGPVDGPSLGLAAAVAVMSCVLDVSVASTDAFTGKIDVDGRLHPVGGIEEKLAAARDRGVSRVFVPTANLPDVPRALRAMAAPVADLASVVKQVFSPSAVRAAVKKIRIERVPRQFQDRYWLSHATGEADAPRWLFTCAASSDPFGIPRKGRGVGAVQEAREGPVLGAWRELRPQKVFIYYTRAAPANDYGDNANSLKQLLIESGCEVECVGLMDVSDPSDYMQVVPAMSRAVRDTLARHDPRGAALYINLSSGTPQMETTWHLIADQRLLPNVHRIQVRDPSWIDEDEPRVRFAEPPPVSFD